MVCQSQAPQLNVIIDSKAKFRSDLEVALTPAIFDTRPRKNEFVLVGLA